MDNGVSKNRKIPERPRKSLQKKKKIKKKSNLKKCVQDNPRCRYCGSSNEVSAHHIVFRSQGGDDAMGNLITLCFECHRKVHDGYYDDTNFVTPKDFIIYILDKINDKRYESVLKELTYEV